MPYPGPMASPQDLVNTFGPMYTSSWDMAQNTANLQQQYNQQNLQAQQMENQRYQQLTPLLVQQQQLQNQGQDLSNQGKATQNADAARTFQARLGVPLDAETKAQMYGLYRKISDDQAAQMANDAQNDALSTDPQTRASGLQRMANLKDFQIAKMREDAETQRAYGVAGIQGQNQQQLMKMEIDAGRFKNRYNQGLDTQIMLEGDPVKRDVLLRGAVQQATASGDQESAQYYQGLLEKNLPAVNAKLAAQTAGNQAKPNMGGLGVPSIAPVQLDAGQPQSPAPQATPSGMPKVGEVRKGYRFKGGNPGDKNNWEKVS
jgi:hypothetical protein